MDKDIKVNKDSAVQDQLAAAGLNEHDREYALNAMRNGEVIAQAICDVVKAFASLRDRALHREPSTAH